MTARKAAAWLTAAAFGAAGGPAVVRRRRRRRGDHRVVILEYHDVGADGVTREGVVSRRHLVRHLRFLRRHSDVVSLGQAVEMLARPGGLERDAVVVTFDDGYVGNYVHAWPVLRAERFPAAIFVSTGFLDGEPLWFDVAERCLDTAVARGAEPADPEARDAIAGWRTAAGRARTLGWLKTLPRARRDAFIAALRAVAPPGPTALPLSWGAVREMSRAGIEIGCHTVSHPILSTLPPNEQAEEIGRARDRIAREIGFAPTTFAYPNGSAADFTPDTVRVVRDAGFRGACTTRRGSNRPGCDAFRLARLGVASEPCVVLAARMAGLFDEGVRRLLDTYGRRLQTRLAT